MAPTMFATASFKILLQKSTHGNDTIRHSFDLAKPLLVKSRIIKDLRSNASTVHWRI